MSYLDEYNKYKKKKDEEKTSSNGSYLDEYNKLKGSEEERKAADARSVLNYYTPSAAKPSADDGRTWFQGGAFDDGYQFGDVAKTILGTTIDIATDLDAGILEMVEGVVDTGATLLAGGSKLFGADDFANDVEGFIKKDIIDGQKIMKTVLPYTPFGIADNILTGGNAKEFEETSVLGDKSDSLVQSGGQLVATAGLQMVGVPWWLTTGVTSFGSEMDNALNQGATLGEAALSSTISAGADILTEKLFGGSGLGEKGLINLEPLTKGITSKVVKTLADFGVDMLTEGSEEVVAGVVQNLASSLYKEGNWWEIVSNEEALDGYLEAFIGGAALGGGMNAGKTANSIKTGRDYRTGLTENEQKVVDKVYNDELAEKEKAGKLTAKEKTELYDDVVKRVEKGYIDTDTIESVLGGESYKGYQSMLEQETTLKNELEALENTPENQFTVKQRERLTEVRKQLSGIDTKTAKSNLFAEVDKLTTNDTFLRESYNERARRGQVFEADLTKYDAKQQATIQKAIDSGILNNTRRTHEFVDMIAKISADKGVLFDFTNNQKLKESGFAINGKQVNGYVTKDGVTLNLNSSKALDTVVGHEITHILEGTELYNELQNAITEYAKSKGDYQGRLDTLTKLYENIKDADVNKELVADLVGDYLFTDADFINNLSTNHRNVFQKIYDEIKYLCKVATAGSQEARELEKVKKVFADAYRESVQAQKNTADSGVKYSLAQYSDAQKENWKNSKKIVVYENDTQLLQFVNESITNKDASNKMLLGVITGDLAERIKADTGLDFDGKNAVIRSQNVRKILLHDHGDTKKEGLRGQIAVTDTDFLAIKDIFGNPDEIRLEPGGYNGKPAATFEKVIGSKKYTMFVVDSGGSLDIFVQTMYIHKNKNGSIANAANANALTSTPTATVGTAPDKNIAQDAENVKTQFSLSDSDGNELSPAVQKRFAKSKVVDDAGNLKVVYHGTPNGEFTIFDKAKGSVEGDFGSGFYFTDNADDVSRNYEGGGTDFENKVARRAEQIEQEEDIDYSEAVARAREELYVGSNKFEVYLNIENPAIVGKTTLLDYESFAEEYDREDYDSDEDYEGDVEQLIADEIDNIIWEVEKNVDVYNTDGLAEVLWNAVNEGGIDIEQLKANINNLYLEDSNGNFVGNEVTRQVIESLGYDGIIDNTVSSKFNMGLSEDTTHYIVFKPNQIKNVSNLNPTDNPDINLSLSNEGDIAPVGKFFGKDMALEGVPVAENARTESVPNAENIAPVMEEADSLEAQLYRAEQTLESLDKETESLFRDYAEQKISDKDFETKWRELDKRYAPVRQEQERLNKEITEDENQRFASLDDADVPPEMDAPYYGEAETVEPVDPFAERDMYNVGKKNVKAYMHENPEVKPYFQQAAREMLGDLYNGVKGERTFNEQLHYESGGEKGWMGTKRHTTEDIASLLDDWGYTYNQIEAGLNAIIEDNGKENNAVSKRIEFMLDNRLRNGYTGPWGEPIPKNDGYINLLKEMQLDNSRREAFDSFMETADKYAPPEDFAPMKDEPAFEGEQKSLDGFEQAEDKPERLTRAKLHSQIIDRIKSVFSAKGIDFDHILSNAHRMNALSINDNTPQRVNDKTFGYEAGEVLNDLTFNKVALNESEGLKWLNKQVETIRNLSKKYKIKPGSKESSAAQMYAEGFWVNEKNEIISYGDAELAKDFPDVSVQNRIKALASDQTIRKIYDDTLSAINASRARNAYPEIPRLDNYFLHFRAMDDTFSRLGLPFNPNDIKAKDLPTDINGMTVDRKPGQPFFTSAMHREGKRTSFDLLGGLEKYLNSAKNQIYHIDDIQTTRALWSHIAERYGQAHGLENLNFMELEAQAEHIQKVYDGHLSNYARFLNEYANNLAGKTALIDRGIEGLLGRRALQTINTINSQVGKNQVGFNVSSASTNFIPLMEVTARLPKLDVVKAFAQTVSNKFRKDGFAENNPALIRRKGADKFSKTPWEKVSDTGYVLMSAVDNLTSEVIVRSKYNELTRKGMDSKQAHIKAGEWAMRVMGDRSYGQMPMVYNSKVMGLITKYQLEVRNALDSQFYDTFQEAKASTKDIENQKARNAATAAKYAFKVGEIAVLNHLFGTAFEKIAGYNPAFDIVSTIMTLFGLDDEDEEDTFGENAEQAFQELLGDLPYASLFTGGGRIPISSALPIEQFVSGKDEYGNEKSRWETIEETLPYYLLPGGYGQIKKTAQGLKMFDDDLPISGSYTDSGNLRYPVEKTPWNVVQAGLFGQYASKNARDYFDNERSPLKEKQIQEFIDVDIPISDYWDYREGLKGKDTLGEKLAYIDTLDLPISKKNILANNQADRDDPIDMADWGKYGDLEEFDYAVKYPEKYLFLEANGITVEEYKNFDDDTKDAYSWAYQNPEKFAMSKAVFSDVVEYRTHSKAMYKIEADKDENGKSISGSKKAKVVAYIDSLPLDYGQKCILFKSLGYKTTYADNKAIIEYLDSREDITYDEMVTILTELGFTVNGNNVYWD
jgi:hypothetical protein